MTATKNTVPKHAHRPDLAEEMHLVVAEELLGEVLEPDEAELQAVGREPHAAQGEDDRIEGREDREDQDERDGGRNEKRARMAVRATHPSSHAGELPAGEAPGWTICVGMRHRSGLVAAVPSAKA